MVLISYGPVWVELRRLFHVYLSKGAIRNYGPMFEKEARTFPLSVLEGAEPLGAIRLLVSLLVLDIREPSHD